LRCAQLAAGDMKHLKKVRQWFWEIDIDGNRRVPRRRVLTGLLLAGDREILDSLLLSASISNEEIRLLLILEMFKPVLEATVDLPLPDFCSSSKAQNWMVRILRHKYAIHRDKIKIGK